MSQNLIKREFLAQALRAYLEPNADELLSPLDAANLSIEFLHGLGLLNEFRLDLSDLKGVAVDGEN